MKNRSVFQVILVIAVFSGCDSRAVPSADMNLDGPAAADVSPGADRAVLDLSRPDRAPRDTAVLHDVSASPDTGPCNCKPGQVWLRSACVPTVKLGCGPTCKVGDPNACPAGQKCDQWAASTCCNCAAALPACVPVTYTGPISGPLRISPTGGVAGTQVTITVEGAAFYIGALFYKIRMGSEEKMEQYSAKPCSIGAKFTPPSPGIYAVEVSQYGGGPPWVLAGFYLASGGVVPKPSIQPGYPCSSNPPPGSPTCITGFPYKCLCISGRCACK